MKQCKKKLSLALIFIGICSANTAQSYEYQGQLGIKRDVHERVQLSAHLDHRFDGWEPFHRHYDAGIATPLDFLGKGWSFGVNYRSVYKKDFQETHWEHEKRPHLNLKKTFSTPVYEINPQLSVPKLKWTIRDRHEFRHRHNGNHDMRQRLLVRAKTSDRYWGLKPFVANELFYGFDDNEFNQNRIMVGAELPKNELFKSSLYLKYKHVRDDKKWQQGVSSLVFTVNF